MKKSPDDLWQGGTYNGATIELRQCGDCAALPGYAHSKGCDVARCPLCGEQQIQCSEHWRTRTPSIWTGIWPGEIECIEYDLWSKWVDGKGWVKTTRDDPAAHPNLNDLYRLPLEWSRPLQRFVVMPGFEDHLTTMVRKIKEE